MTFELVKKGLLGAGGIKPNEISVGKSSFSFGTDILKHFKGENYIELYLDKQRKRVGFKATKSNLTGFKLQAKNSRTARNISAKIMSKRIPRGRYPAEIDKDGFVVISVREIAEPSTIIMRESHQEVTK